MIEDVWKDMAADPATVGYSFKRIGLPSPNAGSMSKCRELCAQNLCGAYGVTWGCPPGAGAEAECLELIRSFSRAAILIKEYDGIDLKDRELLKRLGSGHQELCRRFGNALRKEGYQASAFSDGGCGYCGECTYPDDPCRYPDQRVSSIASYGILMDEYMGSQGIDFKFRDDGMTLYGLIMYDEPGSGNNISEADNQTDDRQ
ncbi:MAG: DUF2284 domain-containing protein [Candidatus Methanoplasma sp.]|jgi:predicted metal-binding protein|nr:DUF2284 domain-containing protein [Candidatus Methanoplasma sp.]